MVEIVDFSPDFAIAFHDINLEWLNELGFTLEPIDIEVLTRPEEHILAGGGHIKVALLEGQPVGVGALKQTAPGQFELTKMGVRPGARGHRIGALLLEALVEQARQLGAHSLYLLSSRKCTAAVALYEKTGWVHDERVMERFGADYGRCDVAMSYPRL